MLKSVVDNDIVEKLCRWNVINAISKCLDVDLATVGYLGSLRFVTGKRLASLEALDALKSLEDFLTAASELVPSEEELRLAASLQERSMFVGPSLDEGESILFSIGIIRMLGSVITGDKRAICSCQEIAHTLQDIEVLRGRLLSLEQILGTLVEHYGQEKIRLKVCSDTGADKTASICFSCGKEHLGDDHVYTALLSYQSDLAIRSDGFSQTTLSCRPQEDRVRVN